MDERSQNMLKIRPKLSEALVTNNMSLEEQFQNRTLRPILKLQNSLFLNVFHNYIKKRKNTFYDLSNEKRLAYIDNALQKDFKLRNTLKGMVIGHFTLAEFEFYKMQASALNKRMMQMILLRLQDQLQYFEKE